MRDRTSYLSCGKPAAFTCPFRSLFKYSSGFNSGGVPRQIEDFESVPMRRQPREHLRRLMRPQPVDDQEHFAPGAPQQPAQEHQEEGRVHGPQVRHEANLPAIGDGRDLVGADVPVRHLNRCLLPLRGVAAGGVSVRGNPHFIAPVNFRLFPCGPGRNRLRAADNVA